MGYGEPELLFYKHDMHSVMEAHRQQAVAAVQNIDPDHLLNAPTPDIAEAIVQQWKLDVPTLNRDAAYVEQREGNVSVADYFGRDSWGNRNSRTVVGTIIDLTVPFSGDKDFFFIRPTTFDSAPPHAIVSKIDILIRVAGQHLSPDQVKTELDRTLAHINKYLGWLRSSADAFNNQLLSHVTPTIEARKSKLLKDRNMVAGLGFNLKPRPDSAKTFAAPMARRSITPAVQKSSSAPFKPEPVLDDANYAHILTTMQNMTQVMERSPSAFIQMDEENLRQHFLVQLNGHYEGAATGETFNFTGKTDILIRVDGRNIFIAECKFWTGEKAFLETIDQLLGYLSWRDTKTAVVMFNRNKDFSAVLRTIEAAIAKHPNLKRGPEKQNETRYKAVFRSPSDADREVTVTVLAFDVPRL